MNRETGYNTQTITLPIATQTIIPQPTTNNQRFQKSNIKVLISQLKLDKIKSNRQ